ncbi:uncharacterized protein LOC114945675 [Nylanderia fulva]|uniref:uncharacterized protein LOC114945675 n=1 Tax=Nylanderia fulva TaxID=613905 RepID=UPI0010FAF9D4|nr:uncharacterized protein LOC114945675 [Nylanderia fulva]
MCQLNFVFLCCTLFLLIISSSKSQQNFTNNKEKGDNLTVQNEKDTDFTTIYSNEIKTLEYDMYEKFANNNTQYDHNHEDEDQILMNSHTNSTNVSYKENFTSQKNYENLIIQNDSVLYEVFENFTESSKSNVVPYEMCHNITCILLCCPLGHRVDGSICIPEKTKHFFPYVYAYVKDAKGSEGKTVDEFFSLTVHNSCEGKARYTLPAGYENEFMIFPNGSVYLSPYKVFAKSPLYCLGVFWNKGDVYQVAFAQMFLRRLKK